MAQSVSLPVCSLEPAFDATHSSLSRPSLSIDMNSLPALSQPSPPSNTLLITDLNDLILFQPSSLDEIRNKILEVAALYSFSPLPSFRRIVCSFYSDKDAITVRKMLEGNNLLRHTTPRIYFGEPTPILSEEEMQRTRLLSAPQSDKLFFISPPPSPPHGWMMRNEDPPNKEVHAHDLAYALAMLKTDQPDPEPMSVDPATPVSISSDQRTPSWPLAASQQRSRSSTIIYNPEDHGHSPNLPAVMVEDVSLAADEDIDMDDVMSLQKMPPKTSRPPVELMG
ncbi:hypothetical protein N7466_007369 [Penicillium verhagenii]|uniref:uncharacterized protein n=1 Tax=Penicillium verhagenii TaxID=1562060 RepID=UPI0025451996|nr:uncharacterized protein N7466_007369 [Penicillium verhagenii]KAJ5928413.1 hypothetical protein N7466_007369 [Penicillium verhagenii]